MANPSSTVCDSRLFAIHILTRGTGVFEHFAVLVISGRDNHGVNILAGRGLHDSRGWPDNRYC